MYLPITGTGVIHFFFTIIVLAKIFSLSFSILEIFIAIHISSSRRQTPTRHTAYRIPLATPLYRVIVNLKVFIGRRHCLGSLMNFIISFA